MGKAKRNKFKGGEKIYELLMAPVEIPDWTRISLAPFQKNFYTIHQITANRPEADVASYKASRQITVNGTNIPRPMQTFDEASFPDYVNDVIRRLGFVEPTPIQAQAWPIALSGLDLIGIAQTGSGKTLAYMLPAIIHISAQPQPIPGFGPYAVILAPTRELAQQIQTVAEQFATNCGLRSMVAFGGDSRDKQAQLLAEDPEIVIATPGRLIDFIRSQETSMMRCTFLVLDEADRMLDMGFMPQIAKVIEQIRPDRQTMMWSATWPVGVKLLAKKFIGNAVHINIGSMRLSANHNIIQMIDVCEEEEKEAKLFELLGKLIQEPDCKIIMFVEEKNRADFMMVRLRTVMNLDARCIHGKKQQQERDQILSEFRTGEFNFLVATDVASRGLDVDDVKYVINYDYPEDTEDYVHRIGRTGRQDKTGTAYTFFTPGDLHGAKDLISVLKEAGQLVNPRLTELSHVRDNYTESELKIMKRKNSKKKRGPTKEQKQVIKQAIRKFNIPKSLLFSGELGYVYCTDLQTLVKRYAALPSKGVGENFNAGQGKVPEGASSVIAKDAGGRFGTGYGSGGSFAAEPDFEYDEQQTEDAGVDVWEYAGDQDAGVYEECSGDGISPNQAQPHAHLSEQQGFGRAAIGLGRAAPGSSDEIGSFGSQGSVGSLRGSFGSIAANGVRPGVFDGIGQGLRPAAGRAGGLQPFVDSGGLGSYNYPRQSTSSARQSGSGFGGSGVGVRMPIRSNISRSGCGIDPNRGQSIGPHGKRDGYRIGTIGGQRGRSGPGINSYGGQGRSYGHYRLNR